MTKRAKKDPEELTEQELEETNGEPLPDREVLSTIRGVDPLPYPIVSDEPITLDDPPPGT